MNYKPLIARKISEFQEVYPEYSYSQMIFSVISWLKKEKKFEKEDLLEVKDEDFYTAICKAMRKEEGEQEFFNTNDKHNG